AAMGILLMEVSIYVSTDGMFGKCHSVPAKEVYTYDVSPSVVQHFRILLEKLSNRGLTWEDETTQQVLSNELSKLKRIPYRPKQNGPVYNTNSRYMFFRYSLSLLSFHSSERKPLHSHTRYFESKEIHHNERGSAGLMALLNLAFSFVPPERFIQNVLKNAGSQDVNVDNLSPQDLDQLSRLIADALQVVDRDQQASGALIRDRGPGPRDLEADPNVAEEETGKVEKKEKLLEKAPTPKPQESATLSLAALQGNFIMIYFLVVGPAVTFKVSPNAQNISTADVAGVAGRFTLGNQIKQIPTKYSQTESTKFLILTVVSILCIVGVLLASTVVYCLRHRSHHKLKEKLTNLGTDAGSDATATYQELCRQRMAAKPPAERPEPISSRINSVSSQFSDGGPAVSPSARGSISSWSEEPAHSNMDISTGHMILSYMEDHLKNKDRLEKEWEALCAYQAEPKQTCMAGQYPSNVLCFLPDDHSRITLRVENSQGNSDYINASPIMDHDPRNPSYIATQGPLPSTVADFWQMVWENGCVVIVMLTPLVENGVKQCYHYWPDEGSNLYHIYEVNLVSEHIWCDDFLVRSFYLKNMQTNETRTVTQFHFLTWLNQNVPETSRTLLDFRRKVNKCYRGRSCPIIVHCSDGAGRSGTYILIDMVLNKMAKGAKEIDIAATLEHLRDQRPGMVQTKDQFEFALTTVAEEVNAILKAPPQ
uniref:Protein tyrosine phosphatase receptor type N2 n=1 Tax=Oryzias latipes TaxID=8090 RepID=A0A3P9IK50_ORYLA